MLDPFTALGVAGNIVQFVDFATKLISKSHKIYKSADGALMENQDLEVIALSLNRLNESLRMDMSRHLLPPVRPGMKLPDYTPENRAEIELGAISAKCTAVASDLLSILRMFKVQGKSTKWKSFKMALKSVWDDDQIQDAVSNLEQCRRELDTELLISLRLSMDDSALKQFNGFKVIDESTQGISETLNELRSESRKNQQDIINAIKHHKWQEDNPQDIAQFSVKFADVVEQERITSLRERFLHRLSFMRMPDRQEEIPHAHKATFDWIFTSSADQVWCNYVEWLKSGKGIYWITGKAGSGKSTLMKYLYSSAKTRQPLKQWAERLPLITASYYFWNSGTSMQKSQTGLLQSILYESLLQYEELIPQIFPYRWRSYDYFGDDLHPFSKIELIKAFEALLKQDGILAKFCFFIDGLDEYDGDHAEIVKLFQKVAASSSVKMCLSSRPLLVFDDAYGGFPKLMLQNLTQNDIKLYTNSQLAKNSRFAVLKVREPQRAPSLVTEIVEKSAGVFLWVTLVVKSLLEGLQNSDRISDLQRRLLELPADLEDLYLLMMKGLEKFYQQQASQLFQIVHRARLPLSVLALSFADEEDLEYAIKADSGPLTETELSFRCEEAVRRLNSRCKGLLEVRAPRGDAHPAESGVDYLHRTVRDFLNTPNVWEKIVSQSDPSFDPNLSLMGSYLLQLKTLPPKSWDIEIFGVLAGEYMEYAVLAEASTGQDQMLLMENFRQTATDLWWNWATSNNRKVFQNEGRLAWVRFVPQVHEFPHDSHMSFLSLAVSYGLMLYVSSMLEQDSQPALAQLGCPLLNYAVVPNSPNIWGGRPRNTKLVSVLLEHGSDPDRVFGNRTTWEQVLQFSYTNLRPLKSGNRMNELLSPMLESMKLLVAAGANPEATCIWGGSQVPAVTIIDETFGRNLPEQAYEVKQLIRRKLEEKVGRERALDIERRWCQTTQELRRQAQRKTLLKEQEEVREVELRERRAKELALLYGKNVLPQAEQDQASESSSSVTAVLPNSEMLKPEMAAKKRSANLKKLMFWRKKGVS
jgi:hypothetical protein